MDTELYEISEKLNNPAEEAYKILRANVQFSQIDKKVRIVAITSCKPGEGKTTTSVNLAISMAQSGMKVLYVDADLRKPMMMKKLGARDFRGLSNYLSGHATFEEIINITNIKGFSFIASGIKTANPVELIGSERFSQFVKKAAALFDMVIIDTPPIGSVIDSVLISLHTDGIILVIQPNTVKRKNGQMMVEQLKKANVQILGVVLNKLSRSEYKNYYENFDYYGSNKKYARVWYEKLISGKRL